MVSKNTHIHKRKGKEKNVSRLSYLTLAGCGLLVALITYILYNQTQDILRNQIKERLIGIVSTASLMFDPEDLFEIQNESAVGTDVYNKTVYKLQYIRNANENITFAYIFRPTNDPDIFEFVADADSLDPNAQVDLDGNGIIDENDALNVPGEPYDVSEIPELRNDALIYPTTDAEPVTDQWGSFLSAYAPIEYRGETVAVIGIDVEITDWLILISKTLTPFLLFVVVLFFILALLTASLVKMWGSRVDLLREIDQQKDELLSIVSHQLATPVSSIKWYLEMMLDGDVGKLTKKQSEHIKTLQIAAANLADLVSMILDVSRIQLGRIKVDRSDVNLGDFFSEVVTIIDAKAQERGVEFTKKVPAKLPTAYLDRRLLHMTLENLLSNAVKYTPTKGKVLLTVNIRNNKLAYSVSDTGCGIPKKDQEKIFGKLFRASNVQKVDGNGFGLYAAKGAVEALGGKISFESKEGKGTIFNVEIPLKKQ